MTNDCMARVYIETNYATVTYLEVYTLLASTTGKTVLTRVFCRALLLTSTKMICRAGTTTVMWRALYARSTSRVSITTVR